MERLTDKVIIVTGAGSGIGRAIAARCASEGARVVVADRDGDAGERAAAEIGAGAEARPVDVTSDGQVGALVRAVVAAHGALHVMINNAGVGVAGTVEATSDEDWARMIDVGLSGTFYGMRHAIPAIRESGGGSVVNVSSVAGLVGIPDRAAYCAVKGGVVALTRAAAIDHAREGVRVNCIAPGTVDTPWVQRITANYPDPEAARAAMRERQPHGRLVSADEIAAMAAYLASDEAGSVVGAVMVVDGGLTAR